jgi:hypothetical protein
MKFFLPLLLLALPGVCAAHQDAPQHIRMCFQWIEVPHPLLTELTSGEKKTGAALHAEVLAQVKQGKAKLLNTDVLVCKSGQKTTIQSFREEIYPTEYCPPGSDDIAYYPPFSPGVRGIVAFESRNVGVTVEVEPTSGNDDDIIDLRMNAEFVKPGPLVTWMEHKDRWGDAAVRVPQYERWNVNTSTALLNGKFEFVGLISPKTPQPAPALIHKIMLFVRADVLYTKF